MFIQLFFLMGCNAIKEDNTKVYVDSYSQTALQQADIIMDGIQSENCERNSRYFLHLYQKKSSGAANRYKSMDEIY